jgi:hypothetical protein
MSEVKKCPKCGGDMEQGFMYVGKGIYWDKDENRWVYRGMETLIFRWRSPIGVQAQRCKQCRLVTFFY